MTDFRACPLCQNHPLPPATETTTTTITTTRSTNPNRPSRPAFCSITLQRTRLAMPSSTRCTAIRTPRCNKQRGQLEHRQQPRRHRREQRQLLALALTADAAAAAGRGNGADAAATAAPSAAAAQRHLRRVAAQVAQAAH